MILIALCLAKPKRAFWLAAVCTAASVSGAALGWWIGHSLWASLGSYAACPQHGGGAWVFEHVPAFHCGTFSKVGDLYQQHQVLALVFAAFTPLPFKVFTIAAGVFQLHLSTVLAASALGRALRFFLVAGLLRYFGEPMRDFIDKYFNWLALGFGLLLASGFLLIM